MVSPILWNKMSNHIVMDQTCFSYNTFWNFLTWTPGEFSDLSVLMENFDFGFKNLTSSQIKDSLKNFDFGLGLTQWEPHPPSELELLMDNLKFGMDGLLM